MSASRGPHPNGSPRLALLAMVSSVALGSTGMAEESQSFDNELGFPFALNGTATVSESSLRLTSAATGERGTAISLESFVLPSDRITVDFDFKIGGGNGGDGISMVLLDASMHGSDALFWEFGPTEGGLVVELDRFAFFHLNRVVIYWNGVALIHQNVSFPLDSNEWHHATFTREGSVCSLMLRSAEGDEQLVVDQLSLAGILESTPLRLGFAGATPHESNEHRVDNIRVDRPGRYQWHLDAVEFTDGETAQGTFVYNATEGNATDHDIEFSTGTTYQDYALNARGGADWITGINSDQRTFALQFEQPFDESVTATNLVPYFEGGFCFEGICSGPECSGVQADRLGVDGRAIRLPDGWTNRGGSVAGDAGRPLLWGDGELVANSPVTFAVSQGPASTLSLMIIGFDLLDAPFKGGSLIPMPDLLFPMPLDSNGELQIDALWPTDLPSGSDIYWQFWIPDASAPNGKAATNGLQTTTL